MSFIDDSNKSLKNRPFDELSVKDSLKNSNVRYEALFEEKPANYLTTRASIFAACVMACVCLLVPYSYTGAVDLIRSLGHAVAGVLTYILVWTFTFRFFERPSLMPLNIMLNLLPAAALAYFMKSVNAFESFSVLSAGVTCLTLMNSDKCNEDEFEAASIVSEVLLPLISGLVSSVLGVLITSIIAKFGATQNAGIRLTATSIFVMFLSFAVSKIRGTDFYMSSAKINDNYDLPSVDFSALQGFVLRRLRFLVSLAVICFACFFTDYILQRLNLNLSFLKYVVALVLIPAFAFVRGRRTENKAQYAVELCLCYALGIVRTYSIKATLISIIAGLLVDVLVTGMFFTYKRSLVHSKRSKYIEGMPLMLLSVALLLIVCAAVLNYWAVML